MGDKLSVNSIPIRYSAYFLLPSFKSEPPSAFSEKMDYFVQVEKNHHFFTWQFQLKAQWFDVPPPTIRKKYEPKPFEKIPEPKPDNNTAQEVATACKPPFCIPLWR